MICSAWLDFVPASPQVGVKNMNGWINRFLPLIDQPDFRKNIGMVFANRCGTEDQTHFVGSSLDIKLNPVEAV